MTTVDIIAIKTLEFAKKATNRPWTGNENYPFNASIDKPAPSMSKHDSDRPSYWRCDDVYFALHAINNIEELAEAYLKLEKENSKLKEEIEILEYEIGSWERLND
jgi:hypothetical protein